jgi:hypothetical protein
MLNKNILLWGFALLCISVMATTVHAQEKSRKHAYKFEQLGTALRSPNAFRTASGAPGPMYWQQRADYEIEVALNDENQSIKGKEKITYYNQSPDPLQYLWLQLDHNQRSKHSDTPKSSTNSIKDRMGMWQLNNILWHDLDLDVKILSVKDKKGNDLSYTVNKTMMRVDLPASLSPGDKFEFFIAWEFNIHDRRSFIGGRSGYEYFEKDGNYIYTMAEWFPRMAVYSDFEGWQNKQFAGRGEFALTFGNYKVQITVPEDHMVASTGVLQNPAEVLSPLELSRWNQAKKSFDQPVIIRTQEEAERLEKEKKTKTKTWIFHADNVRDFAWTSSRKFIWDAMAVKIGTKEVMAMSYYAKEANPLWEQYSTKVVAHTLESYSARTFDYPYPVAISVEAANGMEYPMICFNYGRPDADGTYSEAIKNGMISVIIHEVGHNYFPMIVNSDERQWTWMDEGLNTFLQFLAEQEWDRDYPSRRGPAHRIVDYMKSSPDILEPIMTNSENIIQFGPNAYAKPATALNILRETIMGRELFDFAFKEYAKRWMFKHPTPEDFFRTMEDASGVDLDWFWRGWFFGTDPVDIALEEVRSFKIDNRTPEEKKREEQAVYERNETNISRIRNEKDIAQTYMERDPSTRDFYNEFDRFEVFPEDEQNHERWKNSLSEEEKLLLEKDLHWYEVKFRNVGGLVMPVILGFLYEDGSFEVEYLPAEIWRLNEESFTKVFAKEKPVVEFQLDPYRETADIDESNNFWPPKSPPTRFELFKGGNQYSRGVSRGENPMQRARNRQN